MTQAETNSQATPAFQSKVRSLPADIQLSQSQVNDLLQDDQGFIWMATQYGLDRYDGTQLRTFLHTEADPGSIGCTYVRGLFRTSQGKIWVRCGSTVNLYDPRAESFHDFPLPMVQKGTSEVLTITEFGTKLLLGTSEGLFSITPEQHLGTRLALHSADQYWHTDHTIFYVGQDRDGRWWLLTHNRIAQFDPATGTILQQFNSPETGVIGSLHQDRWGFYWLIAGYRLYHFDPASGKIQAVAPLQPGLPIAAHSGMEDHNGDMWFATEDSGVVHISHRDAEVEHFYRHMGDPLALPSDRVTNLFEDRMGDIWVGFHDVPPVVIQRDRARTRSIRYFPQSSSGLHSPLATSITAIGEDQLLVATSGALQIYDQKSAMLHNAFPALWRKDVFDTYRDSEGRLWIATDKGVARQKKSSAPWQWVLPESVGVRFVPTHNHGLWMLSRNGLLRYNQGTDTFQSVLSADRNEEFYAISAAPDDSFWIGGSQGVHHFEAASGRDSHFPYTSGQRTGPSDPRVNSILADSDGNVWVGTQNGLDRFDSSRREFERLARNNQLGGQIMSCILQDRQHLLWMASNQGILSYDPRSKSFDEHSSAFGSTPLDLSGWGACTQQKNGEMFFGGFGGVVGFFPDDMLKYAPPAALLLTSIAVNNAPLAAGSDGPLRQSISFTNEIRLRHDQNDISIAFTTFNYRGLNKPRYEYQLAGLDKTWLPISQTQSTITYSHLIPGTYTLRFRQCDDAFSGNWRSVGNTLRLVIARPWWQTWWMYALYVLAACLVVRVAWILRIRQLRALFAARMEGRIRERTALARDIHDTLLQDMQGIVLRCESIAIGLGKDSPHGQDLTQTIQRAEQSISEGRDALQAIRTTPLAVSELMGAFQEVAHDLAFLSPAQIKVTADEGVLLECPADAPEIFKIGREAIRNALQHSQATHIRVHLSCTDKRFQLEVEDDGVGIGQADVHGLPRSAHWGIVGMRERAEKTGGELLIEPIGPKGTMVRLTIPLRKESQAFYRTIWINLGRWLGWINSSL